VRQQVALLVMLSGCGLPYPTLIGGSSPVPPPADAGPTVDGGEPLIDAGVPDVDAGIPDVDAGVPDVDAGPPPADAGAPDVDAGEPPVDAGEPPVDAGEPVDAGVPDAGLPPCDPLWLDDNLRARWPITADAAPPNYTLRLTLTGAEAAEVFNTSTASGDDVRVASFDGQSWTELDRVLVSFAADDVRVDLREAGGDALFLYADHAAAGAPPDEPRNVYRFFEDFEGFNVGDDGNALFVPRPAADWSVEDDGGNRVYRAQGGGRHTARIRNNAQASGVLSARMKLAVATQSDHNGLAVRGADLLPADMDAHVVQLRRNEGVSGIVHYRGGSFIQIDTSTPRTIDTGVFYEVEARFIGDTVELFVDGALTDTLGGVQQGENRLGLFGFDVDAVFDDVTLRDLVVPEPAVTLGGRELRAGCR
jgi:hypothetical protein